MLSLANISSSQDAVQYFEKDDYYAKDSAKHREASEWYGKGSEKLKLEGIVEKDDLKDILDGNLPNGEELGRKESDEKIHAAGIDLTFSAPKSVSIKAEVYKDKRIYEAHKKAVQATLKYVEKNLVQTRKMVNGELIYENVDNITVALFRHSVSRNLDPQLHTHCVLANIVERKDKEWRSAYFGKIFDNKLFLGQMYRFELAYELRQLGYEIRITDGISDFELKEIPQGMIEAFSSRSKEIAMAALEYEHVDAKLKAELALKTRDYKKEVDVEKMEAKWQEIAKAKEYEQQQIESSSIVENSTKQPSLINYLENKWTAFCEKYDLSLFSKSKHVYEDYGNRNKGSVEERALNYAINHLSERETVWEEKTLYKVAMGYATGEVNFRHLANTVDCFKKEGVLLIAQTHIKDFEKPLTTKAALEKELDTIENMKSGKGSMKPLYHKQELEIYIKNLELNTGQKDALNLILTTNDRIVGVQGYAGTGKTYMMQHARSLATKAGYNMTGLAASASAARTLEKDAGIESRTIHSFLFKYDGLINGRGTAAGRVKMKSDLKNTIIVVDEASLVSTSQMNGLLKVSKVLDVRVIAIGDIKQEGSVESGKPFYQLQKAGMETAIMGEIVRQKNTKLKAAVYDSINANIESAFKKIRDKIIVPEKQLDGNMRDWLASATANEWLSLSIEERKNTLVTAPSHNLRERINSKVREWLEFEGALKGKNYKLNTLESKGFTQVQNGNARDYEKGDVVLFNKNYKLLSINMGEYLQVKEINQDKNLVILKNENGKEIAWYPDKVAGSRKGAVEVFKVEEISVKEGEELRWTKNSSEYREVVNSATFRVQLIDDKKLTIVTESGEAREFNIKDNVLKHMDYAYSSTVHAAQGRTYDNVIGVLESDHKHLTNQKQFYVTLSRARHNATLITDDKGKLLETLQRKTGERVAATEHQHIGYKQLLLEKVELKDVMKAREAIVEKTANDSNKSKEYPTYKMQDIYSVLYGKMPQVLSEFGFINRGNHYISTTQQKIDGSSGQKGKVYVYANNPGVLVDYTRGNKSIWDYVKENYMPSATNMEVMEYLVNIAGLGSYNSSKLKSLILKPEQSNQTKEPEVKVDKKLLEDINKFAEKTLTVKNNNVLDYLKKDRGYDELTVKSMGLGYIDSKKALGQHLKSLSWSDEKIKEAYQTLGMIGKTHNLIIPYKDSKGEIIGFAARNIDYKEDDKLGKYMYSKGLSKGNTLFNIHNSKDNELIVVEGIFDCLHAHAKGVNNVVALGGTGFNNSQLKLMESHGINKVILCLDNDKAGQEAAEKVKEVISRSQVKIQISQVILPHGIKDPDQIVKEKGVGAFKEVIASAKSITIENTLERAKTASNEINNNIILNKEINKSKGLELER